MQPGRTAQDLVFSLLIFHHLHHPWLGKHFCKLQRAVKPLTIPCTTVGETSPITHTDSIFLGSYHWSCVIPPQSLANHSHKTERWNIFHISDIRAPHRNNHNLLYTPVKPQWFCYHHYGNVTGDLREPPMFLKIQYCWDCSEQFIIV